MTAQRDVDWDGFINARDLGGLPLVAGGRTQFGKMVRSEHPSMLSPQGWEAMRRYGIATIISLETGNLEASDALRANPPVRLPVDLSLISRIRVPIEDGADADFLRRWADTGLWGTPLYFSDALRRWPQLHANALSAICDAPPGVLLHCGRGHDRTGIMSMLLLAIAGVTPAAIADDYLLSAQRLESRDPGGADRLADLVRGEGTTVRAEITGLLQTMDLERYLTAAGLSGDRLNSLRVRLTDR